MTSAGGDAEPLAAVLDADPLLFDARRAAASGIEQPDAGPHELLKVLVARDDDDVHARVDALPRERADDVVGFITRAMRESECDTPRGSGRCAPCRDRSPTAARR